MKAEIKRIDDNSAGLLIIIPESETEATAIENWIESHLESKCSYIMKPLDIRSDITYGDIEIHRETPRSIAMDKYLTDRQKIILLNTFFRDKFTTASAKRFIMANKRIEQ